MLADVRRRPGLGLLVALALFVVAFAARPVGPSAAEAGHPVRAAAVAQTVTVVAAAGHLVERAAVDLGHRDVLSPALGGGPAVAALLLLALVVAAVSGVAGGLGRRRLCDRAPPVLS